MSQNSTSHKHRPMGVRMTAVLTAGAFLFTALSAAPVEASFWEERAAARTRQTAASSPVLLAQLPASQLLNFSGSAQPSLPSFSRKLPSFHGSLPLWAQGAVTPFADTRSLREGAEGLPRVFLVMDAHDVYSAQRNVARLLAHLGKQGKMLVGVEGTSGAFDLERHRGLLTGVGQGQLVDHLLKKGFLNGPEAYGLMAEKTPDLWGVEDDALYAANVQAYRDTLSIEAETQTVLKTLKNETLARQSTVFPPDLQELDREVQFMHEDRGDMGKYVKAVLSGAGDVPPGSQVRRFMEAKSKEDRLSFPLVEQARAAFIERVSPRLSPVEMESLIRETTAFRAGSVSGKEYYENLLTLALTKGVPASAYPAFQSYVEYVSMTDGIDVVALMDELELLEKRAYERLAKANSWPLVEWTIDLRLAERAVQHALTPREWTSFQRRLGELTRNPQLIARTETEKMGFFTNKKVQVLAGTTDKLFCEGKSPRFFVESRDATGDFGLTRLADRAVSLGISRAPAEVLQANLPRFGAFFEAATARNSALLENALAQAQRLGATTVVLVTGGFHSPALEKLLAEKNLSHMVLAPRVQDVQDSATGYLQAFAPIRTPLERLLLGDRLFMNPPSSTARSVAEPGNEYFPSGVALCRAELAYGAALAGSRGYLASFVELWNGRFGSIGRAIVRLSNGVTKIRFSGNRGTEMLLATDFSEGSGESAATDLRGRISRSGGSTVESGEIGELRYALGGRNVTSILPEFLASLGFVFLYWGSSLSPPIFVAGLLGWAILGGISLRGILLGTQQVHEVGHALVLRWLAGPSVRESLSFVKNLSLGQIIPFSRIYIPGLSPSADAPRMDGIELPQGPQKKMIALAGPLVNFLAAALLVPISLLSDPGSVQFLFLAYAGGVNLWTGVTSISDLKMAISGLGDALYCGNLGVLGKRRADHKGMMPKEFGGIARRMWRQIVVRGGQSGGRSILGTKGFVRARILNLKRAKLDQALHTALNGEIFRRRSTGSRPMDEIYQELDHARFATGGPSKMINAHPFVWGLVEGFWNAVFTRKSKVWIVGEGGTLNHLWKLIQNIISHNGDFDSWIRRKGEPPIPNDGTLGRWLTRVLGRGDPSEGDSPKIAGMMELLLTQGQWGAAFRLAYAIDVAESMEDVMSQSLVRAVGNSSDKVFRKWLKEANLAGCRTLQDVFEGNKDRVDSLREQLLSATRLDTHGLNQEKKNLLVDKAIHYFFFNDLQEAGRYFSDRADGTFGLVTASSLYPGQVVLCSFKQPLYIGVDPEKESLVYASELSSVKAAGEPGKNQVTELLPFIYLMEKGEVAHFQIGLGDIPNSAAFPKGFEFLGTSPFPDLSGNEMGGRHSLTRENLERWSSQSETEGGRGWISTRGNRNLSGGVSVAESSDLVLDNLKDVPIVLDIINQDWAGQNPTSPNMGAAEDFAKAVVERSRVRSLVRYPGDPTFKNQIDVLVLGAEYGHYAGEHFASDLQEMFPGLNVKAADSKAFAVDPEGFAIGPDTVVLAISHSGQYFHTVDDVSFLNSLHERGRCGPVFGMAGLIDSVPLGQALGQSYKASAKSNRRLFVTHAGWRLDEPKPVVPLATVMTLTHLMVKIAEKAKTQKFGRAVSDETVRRLKWGQSYLQERSESIFGINRKGQTVNTREHEDLVAVGRRYSQRLTEFLVAMPLATVHLFVVLYLGGNPIQGGFDVLFSVSHWGMFSGSTPLGHLIVTYWQVPYFILAYFVAVFLVRVFQRRPKWGRYVSAPTLFLGDTLFVSKTMEAYLRKLFSLSYGWASWGEFKTGDSRAGFIDEANPSIKRGDVMFNGLPMQDGMRAMTQMTSTQLRGSLSMNSTAESFALGHQAPANGKFNSYAVLAEEDTRALTRVLGPDSEGGPRGLLESRVFSIERLMAYDVIFHSNAARTRDMTNSFIFVLRWVAWPLLFLVKVVSLGKFQIPFFPWDIAETQGRANIFTTQVGKPISIPAQKFSPRAFRLDGFFVHVVPQTSTEGEVIGHRSQGEGSPGEPEKDAAPHTPSVGEAAAEPSRVMVTKQGSGEGLPNRTPESVFGWLIGILRQTLFRATSVALIVVLFTSWGGTITSSLEKNVSNLFNRPSVQKISGEAANSATGSSVLVPANAPRGFVNTIRDPLISFDRSPSDMFSVVERVAAGSHVNVVERRGSWSLVSSNSGKQGWILGRHLQGSNPSGGATISKDVNLRKGTPPIRMLNIPKGAPLAILQFQGKWVQVLSLDQPKRPAVWVSGEYVSVQTGRVYSPRVEPLNNVGPSPVRTTSDGSSSGLSSGMVADSAQKILSTLGTAIPVLGPLARRAIGIDGSSMNPGSVLRQRLMAGSLREFEKGPVRDSAGELVSFIDRPTIHNKDRIGQQMVLAMGYGAVAGESWAQKGAPRDMPLLEDYRRTRANAYRGALPPLAGRALTRLARRAAGWKRQVEPTFTPGALPVINLSEAGHDSPLMSHWAMALVRARRGEPAPVLVVRNESQQRQLSSAMDAWRTTHRELDLNDEAVTSSKWVYLDSLGGEVLVRDGDGKPQVVLLGSMLGTVHVDASKFPSGIEVVTGPGHSLTWDRSDIPSQIAVRLVIGLFNSLSLSTPLEDAQNAFLSVRKALVAA